STRDWSSDVCTTDLGDAESIRIDFRTSGQIVQRANAVPSFDTGGGVATRVPPPHIFAIGSVMDALDFTELERIEDQANISVAGEPRSVMLIGDFVPITDSVFYDRSMAAQIQDG